MNFLLLSLVLLWTLISMTAGNISLGTYGTHIATKKKYYHSTAKGFPNDHQAICNAARLTPLSLDTAVEFEYFLALLRFISMEEFVGIGGRQDANLWYWQSTNVRINYPMQWLHNFPHHDIERNCLYMNRNGFANFHCDERGINSTVFCQKIGA